MKSFNKLYHRESDRNKIPNRLGDRASALHFRQHLKTSGATFLVLRTALTATEDLMPPQALSTRSDNSVLQYSRCVGAGVGVGILRGTPRNTILFKIAKIQKIDLPKRQILYAHPKIDFSNCPKIPPFIQTYSKNIQEFLNLFLS